MSTPPPAKEVITRELHEAVERLQADIARVEFWADALGSFSKPVPSYDDAGDRLNNFILPAGHGEAGRAAPRKRPRD